MQNWLVVDLTWMFVLEVVLFGRGLIVVLQIVVEAVLLVLVEPISANYVGWCASIRVPCLIIRFLKAQEVFTFLLKLVKL